MKIVMVILLALSLIPVFTWAAPEPSPVPTPALANPEEILKFIKLPPGFKISIFAKGIVNARSLARGSGGTIFVGNLDGDKVYGVVSPDNIAEKAKIYKIAENLKMPNGVAFHDGSLFVATLTNLIRFDNIETSLEHPPKPHIVYDKLPNNEWHGWKFIRIGPDNLLYIPVGMPCNVCLNKNKIFGGIHRMTLQGKHFEKVVSGIRNSVGFDWDPFTHDLWFTDNGRDSMGDDIPPDELNHAPKTGMNFGFPYCHGATIPDPEFGKLKKCSEFTPPAFEFPAHVATLGMRFYTGKMFPAKYQNQIFVAQHGSWDRSSPIGARISVLYLKDGKISSEEIFAEGWLRGKSYLGRPVDLEILPDGSMLVSDDHAGVIYRITYQAP